MSQTAVKSCLEVYRQGRLLNYQMGFFSTDAKVTEPPNRSKREKCWESRDLYMSCLDRINVENPFLKESDAKIKKECHKEDLQFQKDCVASWVKYFKEKRPFEIKKERMLKEAAAQNAQIIDLGQAPPPKK